MTCDDCGCFSGLHSLSCPKYHRETQAAILMRLTHEQSDSVNHPTHYGGDVPHEVIKCLAAWGLDALLWNGPAVEDLSKAIFYINARIAALKAK